MKRAKRPKLKMDYSDLLGATIELIENGERFMKRTASATGTSVRLVRTATQRMLLRARKEHEVLERMWERADAEERSKKKKRR